MTLGEYIEKNPYTGKIAFNVWNAKRKRYEEGFFGENSLDSPFFQKHYDKRLRKAEMNEEGRLIIEVFYTTRRNSDD